MKQKTNMTSAFNFISHQQQVCSLSHDIIQFTFQIFPLPKLLSLPYETIRPWPMLVFRAHTADRPSISISS